MFEIDSDIPHERLGVIVTLRKQAIAIVSAELQRERRLTSSSVRTAPRPRARARRSRSRSSRRAERGKCRDDPDGGPSRPGLLTLITNFFSLRETPRCR